MRRALLLAALLTWPIETLAEDPPLPEPRPASTDSGQSVPLPRERPADTGTAAGQDDSTKPAEPETTAPATPETPATGTPSTEQPENPPAPPRDYQTACPAMLSGQVEATAIHSISEKQCGVQSPLSVTGVMANGRMVPLSSPVTLDCGMATELPQWVADVDSYVAAHDKTKIESVLVGTSYACRNVDNQATGNLSFHAFADALDVIGLKLGDGRTVTIEKTWKATPEEGHDIIHYLHDSACSRFTTVLGPDADSFHQDNLHVDLGCHGKTCTARLCQ